MATIFNIAGLTLTETNSYNVGPSFTFTYGFIGVFEVPTGSSITGSATFFKLSTGAVLDTYFLTAVIGETINLPGSVTISGAKFLPTDINAL